jgi:ferritin-like protein
MSTETGMAADAAPRKLLADMLREAAELEHCLLDAYVFAACSIKSMPEEFSGGPERENRRRALQYERARTWKQNLLMIAHEEMLHLHYVQCMLRALGEPPHFGLPARNDAGNWEIRNWTAQIAGSEAKNGVEVPVDPLSARSIRHFVLYESPDSLQDENPFGDGARELFAKLYEVELDLHFERALFSISDEGRREKLKKGLRTIYNEVTPYEDSVKPKTVAAFVAGELPSLEDIRFQSVADFYRRGILPLYEQAFDLGWVKYAGVNLTNEQLDPKYAAQGFLPVGPIARSKRFARFSQQNVSNPLRHYKNVRDIVNEIVEEGEGFSQFRRRAEAFLEKISEASPRAYLEALVENKKGAEPTPEWLYEGEQLRQSHLYRFAMIMVELDREQELAQRSGTSFEPSRPPVSVDGHAALKKLVAELPAQFNACYLVMIAWLSRMYEIQNWMADTSRRLAIEMLASWPLMSLAIRPFLELASFFQVDPTQMFRIESKALPLLPVDAQQLLLVFAGSDRSEKTNERMDYLGMRVLSGAAAWAREQQETVSMASIEAGSTSMILTRLRALSQLDEFEKQFPYRVHGGYSDRMPDLTYQQRYPDASEFTENPAQIVPTADQQPPLYQDTFALRVRFSGHGLVQLSTDPDPPTDESGCTGTHMLHAADGDRRFDRALVWQEFDPNHIILRTPREELPPVGVNAREVALLVTDGHATAGYVPVQVMQSTGAVQTSGVQQDLSVTGFLDVLSLNPERILGIGRQLRVYLREKSEVKPFLNGLNHLVWQDGEPIDPFILSLLADSSAGESKLIFEREIFNKGLSILEMSPIQRLLSARGPCGFDSNLSHIPSWAMTARLQEAIASPSFPISYLKTRAGVLADELEKWLDKGDVSRRSIDEIVSFTERMLLVAIPRGTTVAWLGILLHYGHTLSGKLSVGSESDPILSALRTATGLRLSLAKEIDRNQPNSRWLVKYTKGVMDTDALSDLVYGELYVPLTIETGNEPIQLAHEWTFPAGMKSVITDYACQFSKPFWAPYKVNGNTRSLVLDERVTLEEKLEQPIPSGGYRYSIAGFLGLAECTAGFFLEENDGTIKLKWSLSFSGNAADTTLRVVRFIGASAKQISDALLNHFSPRS